LTVVAIAPKRPVLWHPESIAPKTA